jgi:hypothetical protein
MYDRIRLGNLSNQYKAPVSCADIKTAETNECLRAMQPRLSLRPGPPTITERAYDASARLFDAREKQG